MSDGKRAAAGALGVALALSLGACGGGGGARGPTEPSSTPVPTPTPPVVVLQGGDTLEAGWVGAVDFTTTRTGTLETTVDWTYATNDIDVVMTRGACTLEQLEAEQCTILAYSVSTTAKPEKIRADNAAAGTFTLMIANSGPDDESLSYQVVLTPTTAAAAPPSASSRAVQAMPFGKKGPLRGQVELR